MSEKISKDLIFKENKNGELEFVGNFEDLYESDSDPWGQSADGEMKEYYELSRNLIIDFLDGKILSEVLEIGCGHAYFLKMVGLKFPEVELYGMDISKKALEYASENVPDANFKQMDITKDIKDERKYSVVILNQLLWYVLDDLDIVLDNLASLVKENGFIMIVNAFIENQRYGKEKIDGFLGLLNFLKKRNDLEIQFSRFDKTEFRLNNGMVVLKK